MLIEFSISHSGTVFSLSFRPKLKVQDSVPHISCTYQTVEMQPIEKMKSATSQFSTVTKASKQTSPAKSKSTASNKSGLSLTTNLTSTTSQINKSQSSSEKRKPATICTQLAMPKIVVSSAPKKILPMPAFSATVQNFLQTANNLSVLTSTVLTSTVSTATIAECMQTQCSITQNQTTQTVSSAESTTPSNIQTSMEHAMTKPKKRNVTFAEGAIQIPVPKVKKCQHHWKGVMKPQHFPIPTRNLHAALHPPTKRAPVADSKKEVNNKDQPTSSTVTTIPLAVEEINGITSSLLPALQISPPAATVTLQHSCRFYRCQSVTHPNAVLGMIRACIRCHSNYTIACGNITTNRCSINLNEVECPKCWNSNSCYCGQPFSDRYIGGREI